MKHLIYINYHFQPYYLFYFLSSQFDTRILSQKVWLWFWIEVGSYKQRVEGKYEQENVAMDENMQLAKKALYFC